MHFLIQTKSWSSEWNRLSTVSKLNQVISQRVLSEIVKRPNRIPFFMLRHSVISTLQNYYLIHAFFIIFYYICLIIAVWQGPYGFNHSMLFWLGCIAFYPLIVFSFSFYQIHLLMKNIKQSYLEIINSEVQDVFNKVLNGHNLTDTYHLEKIMNVQYKIHTLAEWPISLNSTLTFLTTLATAIAQILIAAYFKR